MLTRSILYNWVFIYELGMKMIPGKMFKEKYQYIADQIHENEKILEPACGPAILSDYLKKKEHYSGFDINKKFVRHGQKKGLNVYIGNAMDPASYEKTDVVVMCDALHHIGIEHEIKMLSHLVNNAKQKIIICEPYIDNYFSYLPKWLPLRKKLLKAWYNFIERDGNNQVNVNHIRKKKELTDLMSDGFGIIPKQCRKTIHELGENLITTYYL